MPAVVDGIHVILEVSVASLGYGQPGVRDEIPIKLLIKLSTRRHDKKQNQALISRGVSSGKLAKLPLFAVWASEHSHWRAVNEGMSATTQHFCFAVEAATQGMDSASGASMPLCRLCEERRADEFHSAEALTTQRYSMQTLL
jgi:hypothetical protein